MASKIKVTAAALGVAGIAGMAVVTVAAGVTTAQEANAVSGTGNTMTMTTAPTEMETTFASPPVKARAYSP